MIFKTLLKLQTMLIVDKIIQEEFESIEAAIAKYGYNPLRVCETDGRKYELRIRQFARATRTEYQPSPFIRGVNLPAFEPVDVPFDFYYKYVKI
jgi:hypothetical protein